MKNIKKYGDLEKDIQKHDSLEKDVLKKMKKLQCL